MSSDNQKQDQNPDYQAQVKPSSGYSYQETKNKKNQEVTVNPCKKCFILFFKYLLPGPDFKYFSLTKASS